MGDTASALAALKARRAVKAQSARPSASGVSEEAGPSAAPEKISRLAWGWRCSGCERECVPVRDESRCLCGHRLKEHAAPASEGSGAQSRCSAAKCACSGFFFLVAEGSWMLRCRCKHKGVEHNADTRSCAKSGCICSLFDSPWVCNCGHAWGDHTQLVQRKEVVKMCAAVAAAAALVDAAGEVNDIDGIRRGVGDGAEAPEMSSWR